MTRMTETVSEVGSGRFVEARAANASTQQCHLLNPFLPKRFDAFWLLLLLLRNVLNPKVMYDKANCTGLHFPNFGSLWHHSPLRCLSTRFTANSLLSPVYRHQDKAHWPHLPYSGSSEVWQLGSLHLSLIGEERIPWCELSRELFMHVTVDVDKTQRRFNPF